MIWHLIRDKFHYQKKRRNENFPSDVSENIAVSNSEKIWNNAC